MRDLKADRALCEKASQGVLVATTTSREAVTVFDQDGAVVALFQGDLRESQSIPNAKLFCAAHVALPHYIDRAEKAEAEVERLNKENERARFALKAWLALHKHDHIPDHIKQPTIDALGGENHA